MFFDQKKIIKGGKCNIDEGTKQNLVSQQLKIIKERSQNFPTSMKHQSHEVDF